MHFTLAGMKFRLVAELVLLLPVPASASQPVCLSFTIGNKEMFFSTGCRDDQRYCSLINLVLKNISHVPQVAVL